MVKMRPRDKYAVSAAKRKAGPMRDRRKRRLKDQERAELRKEME